MTLPWYDREPHISVIYLMLQYVVAIGGMTAVGLIVWRLLQRQEAREADSGSRSNDSVAELNSHAQNESRDR